MSEDKDPRKPIGTPAPRIICDALGYYWRVYPEYLSMCPQNPDNLPVPEPWTVYLPEDTGALNKSYDSGHRDGYTEGFRAARMEGEAALERERGFRLVATFPRYEQPTRFHGAHHWRVVETASGWNLYGWFEEAASRDEHSAPGQED